MEVWSRVVALKQILRPEVTVCFVVRPVKANGQCGKGGGQVPAGLALLFRSQGCCRRPERPTPSLLRHCRRQPASGTHTHLPNTLLSPPRLRGPGCWLVACTTSALKPPLRSALSAQCPRGLGYRPIAWTPSAILPPSPNPLNVQNQCLNNASCPCPQPNPLRWLTGVPQATLPGLPTLWMS